MNDQVKCPHCGKNVSIPDALTHQIEKEISQKFLRDSQELKEKLRHKDEELQEQKKVLWKKALVIAEERMKEKSSVEIKFLKEQNSDKDRKLEEARNAELQLRREKVRLQEKEKEMELQMQRKIDAERQKISEETSRRIQQENHLKDLEKDKQMNDMRKQIEELKRKSEQVSQQLQGDVLERELKEVLSREFAYDEVKDVPTGIKGADVLQIVKNNYGKLSGTIIWESKRTKAWSDGWIAKLKQDQRQVKAEIAVIISQALPQGVKNIGFINGVWIGNYESIISIALLLRNTLNELALVKTSVAGKQEKKEILWNYLTSVDFRQRLEAMYDSYQQSKSNLDKEKEFFRRKWAREEKSTQLLMENLFGIHGDLQAIIGKSLPELKSLGMLDSGEKQEEPERLL